MSAATRYQYIDRISPITYPVIDVSSFGDSLSAAVASAGADPNTILIAKPITVGDSVSVPSTVSLMFHRGGHIIVDGGAALDISGPIIAGAHEIVSVSSGSVSWPEQELDASWMPDLASWAADLGSSTRTLAVCSQLSVAADLTTPAELSLWFLRGGSIEVADGMQLTLGGPVVAERHRIFYGSGAVVTPARQDAEVEWWASPAKAVADLGSSARTLSFHDQAVLTQNTTFPATLRLSFENDGRLHMNNGVAASIQGPIEAGERRIFTWSGSGSVVLSGRRARNLSPHWWGAVGDDPGDGSGTNDTSAFQAMLTAGAETGLDYAVRLSPGRIYLIDSLFSDGSAGDVLFDGCGATLLSTRNAIDVGIPLRIETTGWITVRDLTIRYLTTPDITTDSHVGGLGTSLYVGGSSESSRCKGVTVSTVRVYGSWYSAIQPVFADKASVLDCLTEDTLATSVFFANVSDSVMTGCTVRRSKDDGVFVPTGTTAAAPYSRCVVHGNTFEKINAKAIGVGAVHHISIHGNTIQKTRASGIAIEYNDSENVASDSSDLNDYTRYIAINGNVIRDAGAWYNVPGAPSLSPLSGNNYGIKMTTGFDHAFSDFAVFGNSVKGSEGDGIAISGSRDFTVTGNTISDAGGSGIAIGFSGDLDSLNCKDFTVTGNNVRGVGSQGIAVDRSSHGVITGNNVREYNVAGSGGYALRLVNCDAVLATGNTWNNTDDAGSGYANVSNCTNTLIQHNHELSSTPVDTQTQIGHLFDLINPGGFRKQAFFYQDNVAASQTDVALSPGLGAQMALVMPRSGSLTAISVRTSTGRTAGSLTAKAAVNGAATALTTSLNVTTPVVSVALSDKDAIPFVTGDRLGIQIDTDSSWAPITDDIIAVLEYES